jgi:hypothetical protein
MRILLLFVSVILFATFGGCNKQKKVDAIPPSTYTMPDLPSEDLEGKYLWHGTIYTYINGKDTVEDGVIVDGIDVKNDTVLLINSMVDYNSNQQPVYKCTAYNDSEIVFSLSTSTITYKVNQNLIVWKRGASILYGVPGQTARWTPVHALHLEENRLWGRTKNYYKIYSSGGDTTISPPDTTGSTFLLFKSISGEDKDYMLRGGAADSTGAIYHSHEYNAGPNEVHLTGTIRYIVANDSISIYYRSAQLYSNTYTFSTK